VKRAKSGFRVLDFLAVAFLVVLLCSCLSFDIGDWPSRYVYPHNKPASNLCGPIGAFCAYYLLYYVGPGIFAILIAGICLFVIRLTGRAIDQCFFRAIGLLLLTIAASTSFYCLWPHRMFEFPFGSGGVLGVATAQFLWRYFAPLGTFILLAATWTVGMLLLADNLLLALLARARKLSNKFLGVVAPAWSAAKQRSEALGEIWQKLSARQQAQSNRDTSLQFHQDIKLERIAENRVQAANAGDSAQDGRKAEQKDQVKVTIRAPAGNTASAEAQGCGSTCASVDYQGYKLPPLDLLAEPEHGYAAVQERVVKSKAAALENLLREFNINARVVEAETGPVVTMFELELAAGVKVSQITNLSNDMARALGVGAVRVVAPLPGKHTIGIEVPNSEKEKVRMKDIIQLAGTKPQHMQIPLFLGKDSSGEALVSDLTEMPHLLIAGTTGSGKSVCINSIITGILLTKRPDEVRLILIDPKMVEMTAFNTIPHLMCPIVTETKRAVQILGWATEKMDERYALLAEARVKNIAEYNRLGTEEIMERFNPSSEDEAAKIPKKLTYIVIIIDELADLMMTAGKDIEAYIVRLAQKSRAVGIHLVVATQRPQATVVTGLIKSNMPTRIGFRVAARMDSRIILDQNGAETLLGKGDMLFLKPGTSDLVRAQGTFVDEMEVKRIVKYLRGFGEPKYHPELTRLNKLDVSEFEKDELFDDAVRIVLETRRGSVSLLQRRLNIGYARASRMIEQMAAMGILGEYKGSQAREVMMTLEEYEQLREKMQTEAAEYESKADQSASKERGPGAEGSKEIYEGSAEGEYHYATVEEQD